MHDRYRDTPLSSSRFLSWLVQHTKKCFIYGKVSYWLINHIQKKRDKLNRKFSDCYLEYKAQPSYEQDLQH